MKKFDLDADMDPFYSRHKFYPFPEAIESNGVELQDVTSRDHVIPSKTVGEDTAPTPTSSHGADAMVDALPTLLEQEKQPS